MMFFKVQIIILLCGVHLYSGHTIAKFENQNEVQDKTKITQLKSTNKDFKNENYMINVLNKDDAANQRFKRKIDYRVNADFNKLSSNNIKRSFPRNNRRVIKRGPKTSSSYRAPNPAHHNRITKRTNQFRNNRVTRQPYSSFGENLLSFIHGVKNNVNNLIGNLFNIHTDTPKDSAKIEVTIKHDDEIITEESLSKLIRTEVFWNWLSGWTAGYGKILSQQVKNLVENEVAKKVDEKCNDTNGFTITKEKDIIPFNNTADSTENNEKINKQNDSSSYENIKANTIYGNAVGSDHITNIFIFYPNGTKTVLNKPLNVSSPLNEMDLTEDSKDININNFNITNNTTEINDTTSTKTVQITSSTEPTVNIMNVSIIRGTNKVVSTTETPKSTSFLDKFKDSTSKTNGTTTAGFDTTETINYTETTTDLVVSSTETLEITVYEDIKSSTESTDTDAITELVTETTTDTDLITDSTISEDSTNQANIES